MANVVIGLPTMGSVDVGTCESFIKMQRAEHKIFPLSTQYSLIYVARDNLIKKSLENPSADYVLFVDSDIIFEKDALIKLIEDDVDIVSGVYRLKDESGEVVGCDIFNRQLNNWKKDSTFEIGRCGMGFCLIKLSVARDVLNHFGTCFNPFSEMGEDYSFCERAKSLGYKIWMNPNVVCKHVGKRMYEVDKC